MLSRSLVARGLSVLMCGLALAGGPAVAAKSPTRQADSAPEPPMRVRLVRSVQEGCEPDCPEWISAEGRITAGALSQFKKILGRLGKRKPPVLIHSGGGLDDEALAIGRLLRARGLDIAVARTALTACPAKAAACRKAQARTPRGMPESGFAVCASACAFILAAGSRRYVGAFALVGVHQSILMESRVLHTYEMVPYRTRKGATKYRRKLTKTKVLSRRQRPAPPRIYRKYETYFAQMGVGKSIMPLIRQTPNSNVHWLADDELRTTRIATHRMNGEQLLRGASAENDGWPVAKPAAAGPAAAPPAGDGCQRYGGIPIGCDMPLAPVPAGDTDAAFGGQPASTP